MQQQKELFNVNKSDAHLKIVGNDSADEQPVLVDKDLLDEFKINPSIAFEKIVKKYQERVYWQIRKLLKNHNDTEDVMQNVFIKAWKGLSNFREEANLYTWLYRIAFNESHTFLSKNAKMQKVDLDPPLFENQLSTNGNTLSGEEIEAILMNALDTLPEKQRQVFELKYFQELKFKEISELLGTSVGGLKASYHLAAKKIEEILKTL